MIRKIDHAHMGSNNLSWLQSTFHFSFANYYNPENMNFGVLRVMNDDIIAAQTGFDMHPHRNMEIITYVVTGELTHADSMGNEKKLYRGEVQYMSAGTGVYHSEHNKGKEPARLVQMWIEPSQIGIVPSYGEVLYKREDRHNKWLPIVSGNGTIVKGLGTAGITIAQDANIYVTEIDANTNSLFPIDKNRQAYLLLIEGDAVINGISLIEKDALVATGENLQITTEYGAHILIVEMNQE
ncbi:MAG: pirin family protein [Bacilli bacterium]